jgi:hypothetical protein
MTARVKNRVRVCRCKKRKGVEREMVDFRSIAPSKGERGKFLMDQTGPGSYRRKYIVMGWGRLNGDQLCSRNVVGRKKRK